MKKHSLNVLYEDEDIIVVIKPSGVDSQSNKGLEMDMVSLIQNHLSTNGGTKYVGVIHRLDKPVCGIMVFAKNQHTAKYLSKQILEHKIEKKYHALVCGKLLQKCGQLRDNLEKLGKTNVSIVSEHGGKEAILYYRVLEYVSSEGRDYTKLEISLKTGRHHQIRVQLSNAGYPLVGDRKYGKDTSKNLALKSVYLKFYLETKKKWMEFTIDGL